jgi:hypothetical protein
MNNYDRSFRIEDLAEIANMSVSSLHRHFKEVTPMSPIQFQKQYKPIIPFLMVGGFFVEKKDNHSERASGKIGATNKL